jgi:hypothetical protein
MRTGRLHHIGRAIAVLTAWLLPGAPAAACALPDGGGITLSAAPSRARPESGAPLSIDWQVAALPAACGGRATLILDMPPRMRLEGEGFVALLPGDEGPFRTDHAADRLRVVVPLEGPGPWRGSIAARPYLLGQITLGSALFHAITEGEGLEETALERSLAPGPGVALQVAPGRPRLVAQEAAPTGQPDLVQLSPDGAHLLQVFGDTFRVTHAGTGALVLAASGLAPRFSPTGRFLHWFPRGWETESWDDQPSFLVGEDFVVFDLVAEEVVLRLADLPRDYGMDVVLGVDWSPGDAFMVLHRGNKCAMSLVQPLAGARSVFVANGPGACDGQTSGMAVTAPAMDSVGFGAVYGYGLFPLTRGASPEETLDLPFISLETAIENGDFRLAGGARSSLGPEGRAAVPLMPAPLPPATAAPEAGAALVSASRGAEALDPVPMTDRRFGSTAPAIFDRLASLGIRPRPQDGDGGWHFAEMEAYTLGEPTVSQPPFDGIPFAIATGSQSGVEMPGKALQWLDNLSLPLIARTEVCAYGFPPTLRLWTHVGPEFVFQLAQVTCTVGTGSIPEGFVILMLANAEGAGGARFVASNVIEGDWKDDISGAGLTNLALPVDALSVWRHWPLAPGLVAFSAPPDGLVFIDTTTGGTGMLRDADAGMDALALLALTEDGTAIVQANRDGRVILHDFQTGARLAEGAYLDDELVLSFADGTFRWTAEGARHARVKFAGDPAAYDLSQLAPPGPDGSFALPPRLSLAAPPAAGGRPASLTLQAEAETGLAAVEVFLDGVPASRHPLQGTGAELTIDLALRPETRAVSVILRDALGARSATLGLDVPPGPGTPEGRLFALAVGTDSYADPAFAPLTQAGRDARRFAGAMAAAPPARYASVTAEVLVDAPDLAEALPARIEAMVAAAGPADTLFLQLSGHGVLGPAGDLYLATPQTIAADLPGTALPWSRLQAALAAFPGRVVVFLDACHSGAVDDPTSAFATNDDALAGLSGTERIAVLSASKGRQLSRESAAAGGGFFTASVVGALSDPATDADGDGSLSLQELYAAVKAQTMALSDGQQTPWLSRNGLWGEVQLW